MRKLLAAFALCAMASAANAAPITTALALVVDSSATGTDYATQRAAYNNVLGNPTILAADGSVVLNLIQFADTGQVEQTALRINNEVDRAALLAAINNMVQFGSNEGVGNGINVATADMDAFLSGIDPHEFASNFVKLVDISTPGTWSAGMGTDPAVVAQDAMRLAMPP